MLVTVYGCRCSFLGIPVNGGPKFLYHVKQHMSNSQHYLVVGLVGFGLPLTVTIRVSRVSVRFSGIWDCRLQDCCFLELTVFDVLRLHLCVCVCREYARGIGFVTGSKSVC